MRYIVFTLILLFASGPAAASECSQLRNPQLQLACTLQGLGMQMPSMPREKAPKESPKDDEFYREELYEYVFRPCALRDAARVKDSKGLDYAVDLVIAAFHTDLAEKSIAMVRGQPWSSRVISYYYLLHLCLMTPRKGSS